MNNIGAYNTGKTDKISLNKMNFDVINLYPRYSCVNAETVKFEIETKLFNIFKTYENKP